MYSETGLLQPVRKLDFTSIDKMFAKFSSAFSTFVDVFERYQTRWDPLGPVGTHLDTLGRIRICLETFGSALTHFNDFGIFQIFVDGLDGFRRFWRLRKQKLSFLSGCSA